MVMVRSCCWVLASSTVPRCMVCTSCFSICSLRVSRSSGLSIRWWRAFALLLDRRCVAVLAFCGCVVCQSGNTLLLVSLGWFICWWCASRGGMAEGVIFVFMFWFRDFGELQVFRIRERCHLIRPVGLQLCTSRRFLTAAGEVC